MIIAATGHRPKWLPCKYDERHPWLTALKHDLLNSLIEDKPEYIISGMALGWDTWFAKAGLHLEIPVHCYVPFKEQGKNWPKQSRDVYLSIIERAAKTVYTSEEYTRDCFEIRDRAMVDCADKVYALYNEEMYKSGTGMTVRYAEKMSVPITHFWRE